jgi:hypothetical protein
VPEEDPDAEALEAAAELELAEAVFWAVEAQPVTPANSTSARVIANNFFIISLPYFL